MYTFHYCSNGHVFAYLQCKIWFGNFRYEVISHFNLATLNYYGQSSDKQVNYEDNVIYFSLFSNVDINITIPEFSGNSYIAYPRLTSEELSSTLTITLRFYPVSPNGLLLFVSYSDLNFGDFFSLALIDRTLQFSYSLGAGVSTVSTSNQLELNAWYIAMVTIEGGSAMLFVNGQAPGFSTLPVIFLNLRSNIWLGGYSNFINITGLTGTSEGFNGSVSLLEINGRSLDLILGAEFGYGVTQSETSTCVGNPCLNGGQCVESGPSFVCVCTDVFTGPLCGSEVDPCVVGATQCGSGSTCQAANDGVTFTCLCRLGRGGDLCDQGMLKHTHQTVYVLHD